MFVLFPISESRSIIFFIFVLLMIHFFVLPINLTHSEESGNVSQKSLEAAHIPEPVPSSEDVFKKSTEVVSAMLAAKPKYRYYSFVVPAIIL